MKIFYLFFIGLAADEERYYLSVCTIFQNEAPYLKEWIEYHRMLGVEHFYLYNNRSEDNYLEILNPYLSQGIAELINWAPIETEMPTLKVWRTEQPAAYNHCISHCSSRWLAVIDVDEFLVPVKHPDLISFLKSFDGDPSLGGIRVNWQIFGTSDLPEIPKDKFLIESLTWKAPSDYSRNKMVKSIVRPQTVEKMFVHYAEYKDGFYSHPRGFQHRLQPVQIDEIRINHYWTRAENFFFTVKEARLKQRHGDNFDKNREKNTLHLNEIYDPIILKFVPQLKARLQG